MTRLILLAVLMTSTLNVARAEIISPDDAQLFGIKIMNATKQDFIDAFDRVGASYNKLDLHRDELFVGTTTVFPGSSGMKLKFWRNYLISATYIFEASSRNYNGVEGVLSLDTVANDVASKYGTPKKKRKINASNWIFATSDKTKSYVFQGKHIVITAFKPLGASGVRVRYEIPARTAAMAQSQKEQRVEKAQTARKAHGGF